MRRRAFWICFVLAMATFAVLLLGFGDDVWSRYCMWRVARADDLDEAGAWLRRIGPTGIGDGTVTGSLSSTNPWFTFWFFALVDTGKLEGHAALEAFGRALEERDDLRRDWSVFVRWREGDRLWDKLDVMAEGFLLANGRTVMFFPVNATRFRAAAGAKLGDMETLAFGPDEELARLRILGILFFLGSPAGEVRTATLPRELVRRPTSFDEGTQRCVPPAQATGEEEPFTCFAGRGIPVPSSPLPGLEEWAPVLEKKLGRDEAWAPFRWSSPIQTIRWSSPIQTKGGVLYDGVWPSPFKEYRMEGMPDRDGTLKGVDR